MNDCPNCEYHRQRAQRWRDEAYKQAEHPLPEREWLTDQKMLDFIEEFMGSEQERHPMFSEGYDLALLHMKQLIEGRSK